MNLWSKDFSSGLSFARFASIAIQFLRPNRNPQT